MTRVVTSKFCRTALFRDVFDNIAACVSSEVSAGVEVEAHVARRLSTGLVSIRSSTSRAGVDEVGRQMGLGRTTR
jgi:hypothetical protein